MRDDTPQEDVIAYNATVRNLGEPNRKESATEKGNEPEEKPREAAVQEDIALNVPRERNQQAKKRTKKVRSR